MTEKKDIKSYNLDELKTGIKLIWAKSLLGQDKYINGLHIDKGSSLLMK